MHWAECVFLLVLLLFPACPPGWENWKESYTPLWLVLLQRAWKAARESKIKPAKEDQPTQRPAGEEQ